MKRKGPLKSFGGNCGLPSENYWKSSIFQKDIFPKNAEACLKVQKRGVKLSELGPFWTVFKVLAERPL